MARRVLFAMMVAFSSPAGAERGIAATGGTTPDGVNMYLYPDEPSIDDNGDVAFRDFGARYATKGAVILEVNPPQTMIDGQILTPDSGSMPFRNGKLLFTGNVGSEKRLFTWKMGEGMKQVLAPTEMVLVGQMGNMRAAGAIQVMSFGHTINNLGEILSGGIWISASGSVKRMLVGPAQVSEEFAPGALTGCMASGAEFSLDESGRAFATVSTQNVTPGSCSTGNAVLRFMNGNFQAPLVVPDDFNPTTDGYVFGVGHGKDGWTLLSGIRTRKVMNMPDEVKGGLWQVNGDKAVLIVPSPLVAGSVTVSGLKTPGLYQTTKVVAAGKFAFVTGTDPYDGRSAIVYFDGTSLKLIALTGTEIPDRSGQMFGLFEAIDASPEYIVFYGSCNGMTTSSCSGVWKYPVASPSPKTVSMTGDVIDFGDSRGMVTVVRAKTAVNGSAISPAGEVVYQVDYGNQGAILTDGVTMMQMDNPDLAVSATARATGSRIDLTVTYQNKAAAGAKTATKVHVNIDTTAALNEEDMFCGFMGGLLDCFGPDMLAPGETRTITLEFKAVVTGKQTFRLTVSGAEMDANPSDNTTTVETGGEVMANPTEQGGCNVGGRASPFAVVVLTLVALALVRRRRFSR